MLFLSCMEVKAQAVVDLGTQYQSRFMYYFGKVWFTSWGFEDNYDEVRVLVNDIYVSERTDFDFNDLVFDAKFTDKGAKITLRAVGTTKPIKVGGKEAHELFGVPTSTLINTKEITFDPISFDIEGDFEGNYNNINVEIQTENGWFILSAIKYYESTNKLAVPTTTMWCLENECIADIYPDFKLYLESGTYKWWENYKGTLGIQPISSDNPAKDLYSILGNKLQSPSKGINIIKMSDGTVKKVMVK